MYQCDCILIGLTLCFAINFQWIYCTSECDNYIRIDHFSRSTTIYNTTDTWLSDHANCLNGAADSGNSWILLLRSPEVTLDHLLDIIQSNISEHVRTLDMKGSNISTIRTNAFKQFTRMDHIILRKNQIQFLSECSFCNLTRLRKIDLSDNLLKEIKSMVFNNLPNLREVHLSQNKIKRIAVDAFESTPRVFKILLDDNNMKDIPYRAFESIQLQELGVSGNNIIEISEDIRKLQSLKILHVENSSLQHVSKYIATLADLKHLYIGHNNLTSLPVEMASMVNGTIVRGLDSNPWRCDCNMYWMIQLVALGFSYGEEIQCWEPVHMNMSEFDFRYLACDSPTPQGVRIGVLLGLSGVLLSGIFAAIVAICMWKRRTVRPRRHVKMMINTKYYQAPNSCLEISSESILLNNSQASMLVLDEKIMWERIYCEQKPLLAELQLGRLLGRGAFGDVYEGCTFGKDNILEKVAVKKIREIATKEEAENLRKELQNMTEIGKHQNIIQIYGSGYLHGCPIIVMELAEHGDLLAYLHRLEVTHHIEIEKLAKWKEKTFLIDKFPRLLKIIWDVAKGMEYMSRKKIVHRDLAARNILLAENFVAKISDFGLSRDVYESGIYSQKSKGRLPYKWMSPETLSTGKFTTKSDVWSYGVLLWEVVTLGSSPYPGIPPHMLTNMYQSGYFMPQPPLCPANIYSVMERCWKFSPEDRPMFRSIVEFLSNMLHLGYNQEYLQLLDSQ